MMTSTPLIPPTTSPIRGVRDRCGEGMADVVEELCDEVADVGKRDEELLCESLESVLH